MVFNVKKAKKKREEEDEEDLEDLEDLEEEDEEVEEEPKRKFKRKRSNPNSFEVVNIPTDYKFMIRHNHSNTDLTLQEALVYIMNTLEMIKEKID